jgi:hypothetical protein
MMPECIYSVQTPLRYWRIGPDLRQIDAALAQGAALQAIIDVPGSIEAQYVACYGLQIFWNGRAACKLFQLTARVR